LGTFGTGGRGIGASSARRVAPEAHGSVLERDKVSILALLAVVHLLGDAIGDLGIDLLTLH